MPGAGPSALHHENTPAPPAPGPATGGRSPRETLSAAFGSAPRCDISQLEVLAPAHCGERLPQVTCRTVLPSTPRSSHLARSLAVFAGAPRCGAFFEIMATSRPPGGGSAGRWSGGGARRRRRSARRPRGRGLCHRCRWRFCGQGRAGRVRSRSGPGVRPVRRGWSKTRRPGRAAASRMRWARSASAIVRGSRAGSAHSSCGSSAASAAWSRAVGFQRSSSRCRRSWFSASSTAAETAATAGRIVNR